MHVTTKVKDLSIRQWDYLQDNVERAHQFRAGEVRVCVMFELTPDLNSIHVELPIVDLAGLLTVLAAIEQDAQAEAILTDAEQIVGRVTDPENEDRPPYGYDRNGNVVALDQNGQSGEETAQDDTELELLDAISERPSTERPDGT